MDKILTSLQEYTKDFYSKTEFGDSNVVGSPLGSWLLLASIASSLDLGNNPALKSKTEDCLHMSMEDTAEAVHFILDTYPALNYVSQAWTTADLSSLPAVQQWVKANTLVPYEGEIPSQKQIDEWASTNTNDLIKEFPAEMTDATLVVIANIIYSKLAWKTKFRPVPAEGGMTLWGVNTILNATATRDVTFWKNESDVFAFYKVKAAGDDKEFVSLITCLSREATPLELMESLNNKNSMTHVFPDEKMLLDLANGMYRVKEVKRGTSSTVIEVNVPAWDASSQHKLLDNSALGYQELTEAFSANSTTSFTADAKQIAVAKFDKDGFEAAALTALVMARCAMPQFGTQTVYELNFTKPFVFVSYTDNLPVFSGYICKAKEGE